MQELFVLAIMITLLFCASKFVEMKYLNQEMKPLKEVVRDGLVVLVCSLTGGYIFFHFSSSITDFFNVVTETKVLNTATTQVFTDKPEF
jgi:multisubunit Na+/H+ antiporter MnhB subunit